MSNMFSDFFKGKQQAGQAPAQQDLMGLVGDQAVDNPYLWARREWNERTGSYIARARSWRIVAVCSLGVVALLSMALVYQSSQSKVQPYIVQVDKIGAPLVVGPVDKVQAPDQSLIRYHLASYITDARSITPDPVVQKRWLDRVYGVSARPAQEFLSDYYKKNDPFVAARQSMVSVDINSALPLSDKSWQINWEETKRSLHGHVEGRTRYQAVVQFSVYPPTTAAEIMMNPTGLIIDHVTWTQQL